MSDLISRNEALALIESMMETYWDRKQILSVVRNGIEKLPSAERKERWLFNRQYHEADECVCSGCGQLMTTIHGERMNYCPNCGAKMEVTE